MTSLRNGIAAAKRTLLSFAVAAALVISAAVVAPAPAAAISAPRPAHHQLSAKQKQLIAWGKREAKHAVNRRTKVLNYSTADRYDQGHTTWRRQFAGGWITAGGRVSHISKAERKRVQQYVHKISIWYPPAYSRPLPGVAQDARRPVACRGHSGVWSGFVYQHGQQVVEVVVDMTNCQLDAARAGMDVAAGVLGILALLYAPATIAAGVAAAVLLAGSRYISYCQDKSDIGAVSFVIESDWIFVKCHGQ